jgi:hypothetical protein
MGSLPDVIKRARPAVVRLAFFQGSEQIGGGSGFLTAGKLVSNSHVIRGEGFDAVEITFGDHDENPIAPVRLAKEDFYDRICDESTEHNSDYVVLDMSTEPEFDSRVNFELQESDGLAEVGDQVLFLGFPFLAAHITAHVRYISANYRLGATHRLQIDGSINPGNSGGPLLHLESGKVVAIITRMEPGLYKDFDDLVGAIRNNVQALSRTGGARMTIGGIDPVEATRVTMSILGRIAANLKRSANVGIGWAYCSEHVLKGGGLGNT